MRKKKILTNRLCLPEEHFAFCFLFPPPHYLKDEIQLIIGMASVALVHHLFSQVSNPCPKQLWCLILSDSNYTDLIDYLDQTVKLIL